MTKYSLRRAVYARKDFDNFVFNVKRCLVVATINIQLSCVFFPMGKCGIFGFPVVLLVMSH